MRHRFAIESGFDNMAFGDSASLDAFGRLRVSNPVAVFDAQLTYNLLPLQFEAITSGGGTVTHDATNRCGLFTFAAVAGAAQAEMRTYHYHRYQPGRSQQILLTFNFIEAAANVTKYVGYSDGTNGIELQYSPAGVATLAILSNTGNGNQGVAQAAWNLDRMDGTGPSGVTLDWTKAQIMEIDLQALYVGRVRIGFTVNGITHYVHQFLHSNLITVPYITNANRPIRAGMVSTGAATTTMRFICCSVMSEGGVDEMELSGYPQTVEVTSAGGSGARAHLLSLRPLTTFNGIANRIHFQLESVNVLVTGNFPVYVEVVIGQAITGPVWANVNTTYSSFEYGTGTISGSPAYVLEGFYIPQSGGQRGSIVHRMLARVPITLDAAGAVRSLGTLSILGTGVGGSSAVRVSPNWLEIR